MTNLLQVEINIVFSILLLSLFIHAYFKMNKKTITNRLYMWIIGLTCFILVFEIFSVLLNEPDMIQWILLNKAVNTIGFIVTPFIPYLGYLFCKEWVDRFQKDKCDLTIRSSKFQNKSTASHPIENNSNSKSNNNGDRKHIKINYLLLLPLIINAIGALLSFNGGLLFWITDKNVYERGPLFFVLPIISYFYFAYSLYFIYKNSSKFSFSERIVFSLFFIVPAVFTLVQLRYFVYLTTWNSTAIIVVITYVFMLNDQVYRDSLTGLENRLAYDQYIQKLDRSKLNKICMIYIDIDNFKDINDKYGHIEGDEAIKTFANIIMDSFTLKRRVIRFGGDEFLIVAEEQQQKKVDTCLNMLTQNIRKYNENEGKPYNLSFSYGMERYSDKYANMSQLMDHVDHMMYVNKQNKKDCTM